jgi:hypothetical protein
MARNSESPIKDRPLRLPAQSLEERRQHLFDDKLLDSLLVAVFLLVLAGMEWSRYFFPKPPAPWLFTVVALVAVGYFAWRFVRLLPVLRSLRLGIDGEKAVGQFLERLRSDGYQVFHDIVGQGFNVDHAIIGPAGVYTIETKTWSKPARGQARVKFDGEKISVGAFEPDRNPVIQSKAQASWLKGLLKESTGKSYPVRPVVVFPGWYIDHAPGSMRDLWVLEPKALPGFLSKAPAILTEDQIKLASFHLSRFIRSEEAERQQRRK